MNPGRDIPEEATRVHGITLAHLADKPRFADIADEMLAFFGDDPLVAHNAAFDFGFIDAELARLRRPGLARHRMIDTLAMAKLRFPGLPNSLDALCRRFGIDLSARTTHNALLDCKLLAEVYIELTGGRQRGLWGGEADAALGHLPMVASYAAVGARTPRPVLPSEAELAAHATFVARLASPVWAA